METKQKSVKSLFISSYKIWLSMYAPMKYMINCVESLYPEMWTLLWDGGKSILSICGLMIYLELCETSVWGQQMTAALTAIGY